MPPVTELYIGPSTSVSLPVQILAYAVYLAKSLEISESRFYDAKILLENEMHKIS